MIDDIIIKMASTVTNVLNKNINLFLSLLHLLIHRIIIKNNVQTLLLATPNASNKNLILTNKFLYQG